MIFTSHRSKEQKTNPRASAPDHWRRKPRRAETRIAEELAKSHSNSKTPGGSSHGMRANKKKIVNGVVFHINLQSTNFFIIILKRLLLLKPQVKERERD